MIPGTGARGTTNPELRAAAVLEQFPLNNIVKALLQAAEEALSAKVEIEFAATMEQMQDGSAELRLGFLQVRPMAVSSEWLTFRLRTWSPRTPSSPRIA